MLPAANTLTPKVFANKGIAGANSPNPRATKKAISATTPTSRGMPSSHGLFRTSREIPVNRFFEADIGFTDYVLRVSKVAVRASDLVKRFGSVTALDGVSFEVEKGTVTGLLGPNGAGKTTAVRILTTLLKPNAGEAQVAGLNVVTQPDEVRGRIGLSGQYAAIDEDLTGRENLEMVGMLLHMPRSVARERANELLARFDLAAAGDRPAKGYSGGMRRRLDLAASLVANPEVLFLDEPTTGLDPRARIAMWQVIRDLVSDGTTVLLTTQYLDEADSLADQIVVIDHGRVIAKGTPNQLKREVGGERVEVHLLNVDQIQQATGALQFLETAPITTRDDCVMVPVSGGGAAVVEAVRALDAAGVGVSEIGLRRPTLDDVFLSLTGHAAKSEDVETSRSRFGRTRKAA
jgi:ABC-2 type transport system ATP-binding protein